MIRILTIETTCDETAAAVITDSLEVLGSVVASQEQLHRKFGGVVPEIASRAHLENIVPVIDETIRRAGIQLSDLDAIAVANTPGLAGSLLVGLSAAKSLCVALRKPLIAVNHLQAHIYACKIAFREEVFPCVGLIVSGGHSSLYRCATPIDFTPLGGTIDDAAGEAFDKVAAMLGLPYPGGPSIQQAAENGNPKAYSFPRSLLDESERLAFSFSGLKTAVRYRLVGPGKTTNPATIAAELSQQEIADIAASFQEAVVDCLVGKSIQALRKTGMKTLCLGGGVAANNRLRRKMEKAAQNEQIRLFIAPIALCTDNAVMGAIAIERFSAGLFEPLDLDVYSGLIRNDTKNTKRNLL
ncbi:MAG: tRNA (adenosine(37)-N6)-threonylcarbamoyltransferase complex transferase subunit TsaD [Planctomycetaceae bacterium]|jgi:N6-L-threonylcarbamoyladenine synthase|nr:tRNA (adenosine(37)-N6)-threonylcarbamoyltransferase complex transferase subunit TsaD [Planctomycetaceae bacterium]